MKKNLKSCIEVPVYDEAQILLDMNQYDLIERAGAAPDLHHKKSAHMTAAWRFADQTRITFALGRGTVASYRYLTFSVFAVAGEGGTFSLLFATDATGKNGYEITLAVTRDGWNTYRLELPFLRAVGEPTGWEQVNSVCFDCVTGGQANRTDTVLYVDSLFGWELFAPPLYTSMPEIKGAAVFSRTGNFSIVDRKRIANTPDASEAKPFEKNGILWLPMAPVAAGIAHSAVVDNLACTLSFTYRRKKYTFSANRDYMTVGDEKVSLGFRPAVVSGMLFFPAEFVRTFFHWRQIFVDPMGLVVLSNRKNIFLHARDAEGIRQLTCDCTFLRPDSERMLNDLHRRFPNPARGRLLASYDDLMQLRREAKAEGALKDYVEQFKTRYGLKSEAFAAEPLATEINAEALAESADRVLAFAMLYRVTGDKKYADRTALECEALSALSDWSVEGSMASVGEVALAMSIGYDWCRHVWSEGRKALLERAILRNAMRPSLEAYDGKRNMWQAGSVTAAQMNAGLLAVALAFADAYPQTSQKLLERILRNVEPCFAPYAPDGGYSESVGSWEKSTRALALMIATLQKACGTDYGLSSAPGFLATGYFPVYTETENGVWNYHNCAARAVDTSVLFWFAGQNDDSVLAWMHRREILSGKKQVEPLDILFYQPVDDSMTPQLPLDAVYRKAGLAVMRSGWGRDAAVVGLHGGSNLVRGGDLDAGGVFLEMGGERFFVETGAEETLPVLLRRRAAGQNTLVVSPIPEPAPDQNPDAVATLTEMRSSPDRAYAVVDMTSTNDAILRAKRGVMLTEARSVAVIQDELTLVSSETVVWTAWTRAEVELSKSGRAAKLRQNGKILLCRLCGVGSPAKFALTQPEGTDLKALTVAVEGKEKFRMAVVCRLAEEDTPLSEKVYDVVPMSRWSEG
ncbi:MAG: hypothetical protein IJF33_03370 [Clostridia bacterium]|nr:hypothetical protein [Clostridia bacterium]